MRGYALLNWFQGLIAAILPAHERAASGCAYNLMQKTFRPEEGRFRAEQNGPSSLKK